MLLKPGGRLGPYEILDAIGAGGMGKVYRAHDSRLGRDVAIKILPDTVASDPERRARFEREARLLAALNDPRIAAIYGVEEDPATGALALVLELVEGPTLEDRLASGPLPIDEALDAARQIAGALEAAHDRGVIHRDLKPANVKVTAGGGRQGPRFRSRQGARQRGRLRRRPQHVAHDHESRDAARVDSRYRGLPGAGTGARTPCRSAGGRLGVWRNPVQS